MSIFFNYDNPICNECNSPSVFSFDPSILSLKELLLYELKHISYYILKLSEFSVDTTKERDKVINFISLVFVNLDFKRSEFNNIIEDIKGIRKNLEKVYLDYCKAHGTTFQPLKPSYDLSADKIDIISAIGEGERQAILKNTILSKTKKTLYEVMMSLIKTTCLYLVEIENYGEKCDEAKDAVIRLLNTTNFPSTGDDKWIAKVNDFVKVAHNVMKQLRGIFTEQYGPITEKEVSLDLKQGNAILVSGHFLRDLEDILKATQDQGINVYTHNDMMVAHSLDRISSYPNLAGHYHMPSHNIQMDFASFPGAILITKNSQPLMDIIRGRIFTLDDHSAFGMSKIKNNDFGPIIQAARDSAGFKKDIHLGKMTVGYNRENVLAKTREIIQKVQNNEIKHLFIVDLVNQYQVKDPYIETLLDMIPNDSYTISLSFKRQRENIWHIDSYYGYSLFYLIMDEITSKFNQDELNRVSLFLTQCNMQTITHILDVKNMGINSIYLGNCCPTAVNPSLIKGLDEMFDVRYIKGNPIKDLEDILNKGNE